MALLATDKNGLYKPLADGRVLRVRPQVFNAKMTLSVSREAQWWAEGW